MKLKEFLFEEDKNIEIARKALSKKHKVDPKYLSYIGMEDYEYMGKGYNFNITDPKHKEYKSTKMELIK